jgi:MerR family mercuric resistance operon transcriptional regulator
MNGLTIGQVARQAGVGVETIRFYERKGLVEQPAKPASGFRRYPVEAVQRVRFIQRAKSLGFSLREIAELLDLRLGAVMNCDDVLLRAETKVGEIEKKVEGLTRMKEALGKLIAACASRGDSTKCPILEALGDDTNKGRRGKDHDRDREK